MPHPPSRQARDWSVGCSDFEEKNSTHSMLFPIVLMLPFRLSQALENFDCYPKVSKTECFIFKKKLLKGAPESKCVL